MIQEARCHVRLNCDRCDNYEITGGSREFLVGEAKRKGWKVGKHGNAVCPKH